MSVDGKWKVFVQNITSIMDDCIPHKLSSSRFNLPWFNRSLRKQKRKKQRLYNKAKKSGSKSVWLKFKIYQKFVKQSLRSARNKYYADFSEESLKENPK